MNPYPRTWLEIDLPALSHNLGMIRQTIGVEPRIALVAKADAYGHGLIPICRYAVQHGVDWIGVATVQEGIALRDAGIEAPVLVLSPILAVEAEQAVFYRLRLMVEGMEIALAASQAATAQRSEAIVHLAVDTGLSRFGCLPNEAANSAVEISGLPNVLLEGIGTHFVDSGHDAERTQLQLASYAQAQEECARAGVEFAFHHVANSAGSVFYPDSRCDLVRVGIAAYGIDPYGLFPGEPSLRPVLSWKARAMSVRHRAAGTTVGYGATFRAERDITIATLGIGYGDGYPRELSNHGFVEIGGRRALVVGLVCMDQALVDVTDVPHVKVGDEATIIGPGVSVVELAGLAETNCHEIVTRIMSRVPRRYVYE